MDSHELLGEKEVLIIRSIFESFHIFLIPKSPDEY